MRGERRGGGGVGSIRRRGYRRERFEAASQPAACGTSRQNAISTLSVNVCRKVWLRCACSTQCCRRWKRYTSPGKISTRHRCQHRCKSTNRYEEGSCTRRGYSRQRKTKPRTPARSKACHYNRKPVTSGGCTVPPRPGRGCVLHRQALPFADASPPRSPGEKNETHKAQE